MNIFLTNDQKWYLILVGVSHDLPFYNSEDLAIYLNAWQRIITFHDEYIFLTILNLMLPHPLYTEDMPWEICYGTKIEVVIF